MVLKIEFMVFWDVAPCSVVVGYQCFIRGPCCLHLQGWSVWWKPKVDIDIRRVWGGVGVRWVIVWANIKRWRKGPWTRPGERKKEPTGSAGEKGPEKEPSRKGRRKKTGKYHWHVQLYPLDRSAMAEHTINLGHHILLNDTSILAKKPRCMECLIREAREIEVHPDNMNREEGFTLSKSWKPLIQTTNDHR